MGGLTMGVERADGGAPARDGTAVTSSIVPDTATSGDVTVDLAGWEPYLVRFDEHAGSLLRLAVLLAGGDRPAAEDLVQETFIAAFEPWRSGRVDNLGGYLRRTLSNRATSAGRRSSLAARFRSHRRRDDRGDHHLEDDATNHVMLCQALQDLPPRQRAAVVLRFYEGLSVAECAAHLGVSEGTIKSQTSDALSTLRRVLETTR